MLPRCLAALNESDLDRRAWELIVVDDASTDDSASVADVAADRVIRLGGRARGPAFARNRGFEAATAPAVAFVDADVSVHTDVLGRLLAHLSADRSLAGVFGSYDDQPSAPGFIPQYRNLLHHYVHHRNAGPAETFWAGCGAVRSTVFRAVGMFDENRYDRAQIEDVELGYRLRDRGHRLLLDPTIQGTHHKRWTLRSMLRADFRQRALPWMELLLARGSLMSGGGPSVGTADMASVFLAGVVVALGLAGIVWPSTVLLGAAVAAMIVMALLNHPLLVWFSKVRGPGFALRGFFMLLLYNLSNVAAVALGLVLHMLGGGRRRHGGSLSS